MSETPTASTAETLRNLLRRSDNALVQAFSGATQLCGSRSNFEVTPEHLLLRLLDDASGDIARICDTFKVDRPRLRRAVLQVLDALPTGHRGKPALSPKLVELFVAAGALSDEWGFDELRTGAILLAMALNPGHLAATEHTAELDRIDADQLREHFHEIVGAESPATAEGRPMGAGGGGAAGGGALEQFTIDLTAKAADGGIDPVFGRDPEIRQMIDILGRRRKNNPIIVGEPGTGKTAIVEGLALRIHQGDVPPFLQGVRLISLDMGLLQAGAGVKGEFENRLKNVIKEIKESEQPTITFIDEAHTLIGAGGSQGGGDAANLLKPALARGELRTVAATTWAEYKKYFEKDAALERRFQLVRCGEPTVESTVVILRGLKDIYEKHHKVILLDEAITAAAELSKRYISGRFLPDKAVDLVDTAAARVAVALSTTPAMLEDVDRGITNFDTAIRAMQRDDAAGVNIDQDMLAQLQQQRETLLAERETLTERWHAEKELVDQVRELRGKLLAGSHEAEERPKVGAEQSEDAAAAEHDAAVETAAKGAVETADEPAADPQKLRAEIDEAMAKLREMQGDDPLMHPQVDAQAVAAVLSDWTGIPVGKVVRDEIQATLEMEDRLRGRVVGQDHALQTVAEKLRANKAGLGNPQQPMGVFLLVGPSGTGKTELAMSVADLLFGGDQFLTVINMSEFMEKHTVSQLKGSPPGYVGYGEGGVLTEAVRQQPYSVVLLDEVEKAHPDVMNLFYQVFDKGNLADGEGRIIDFKNTVLFMTSNLGTDVIQQMCENEPEIDIADLREGVYPHLREHFKPALVARMTVVPFLTLGDDVLQNIARMKLGKVGKRLGVAHKIHFAADDAVYAAIASRCQQVDLGARQIDHVIDREILPVLSRQLLEQLAAENDVKTVQMGVSDDNTFAYSFA